MLKKFKPYLPNTSDRLSLVGRRANASQPDFRAYWPLRLTQIVGGKRWSLALVWYKTPHPIPTKEN